MQYQETTIILQNPDGTIQIATQPHLKNKKIIECYKCKTRLIFESSAKLVKCSTCSSVNGVPGSQVDESNMVIIECAGCATMLKARQNSYAVQCPFCKSVTCI